MYNIFFTADTHFNHTNIIKYCNRPFKDVDHMNEEMIRRWNEVVRTDDTVYHLGDFGFGDIEIPITRLNGFIVFLTGDHDKGEFHYKRPEVLSQVIDKQMIVMCHYAMRVWPKSHFNSWHLFGHSHGRLSPQGKSFDVGVDTHNFYPYSFAEVKSKMNQLPDNFNYVGK